MEYIKVIWRHEFVDEPIELDCGGYATPPMLRLNEGFFNWSSEI